MHGTTVKKNKLLKVAVKHNYNILVISLCIIVDTCFSHS